jgi:hypothetical protein
MTGDGDDAELWCPSLRCWVHGFSVVGHEERGLVIRRHSDDAVLPVAFAHADVRLTSD